jgi:hypothetical protein
MQDDDIRKLQPAGQTKPEGPTEHPVTAGRVEASTTGPQAPPHEAVHDPDRDRRRHRA